MARIILLESEEGPDFTYVLQKIVDPSPVNKTSVPKPFATVPKSVPMRVVAFTPVTPSNSSEVLVDELLNSDSDV